MRWFEGNVASAIQEAFQKKKIFLVYLEGDTNDSQEMEETWRNAEVENCVKDSCICVKVHFEQDEGKQFAMFYPVLLVPATYLIDETGVPVDIIPGFVKASEFVSRLTRSIKVIEDKWSSQTTAETSVDEASTVNSEDVPNSTESASEDTVSQVETPLPIGLEQRVQRAEQLIQSRREAKQVDENEKEKEKEFKRRREGQEISKARRDRAENQVQHLAFEIAKKKIEEKAAREAVREQIRRDQAEKAEKFLAEKEARNRLKKETQSTPPPACQETSVCRLQLRYSDGTKTVRTFPPETLLQAVVDHIIQESEGRIPNPRLATVYPKHDFTTEELHKSLRDLQLMPSSALLVRMGHTTGSDKVTSESNSVFSILFLILAPLIALLSWLKSSIFGETQNESASQQSRRRPTEDVQHTQYHNSQQSTSDPGVYRRQGNIYKFKQDDDDDEDRKTWNGNSTQQM